MRLLFPNNFITRIIHGSLTGELKGIIEFKPASLLTSELLKDENAAAFIPTTDLLKHKELFVSKSFGLSFEGSLCNSYFYFNSGNRELNDIYLAGDVSTLEALLLKIILKELYASEAELKLIATAQNIQAENALIVGDINFQGDSISKGISFSDEIQEIISLPFVNFVLASKEEKNIKETVIELSDVQNKVYDTIESGKIDTNFSRTAIEYIKKNVASIVLSLDSNDLEGMNQLIRLPYYYGIIEEIVELKLV